MIKETIEVTCDCCGNKCKDKFDVIQLFYNNNRIDVCHRCTNRLAQLALNSKAIIPRRYCPECKGKGYIKEGYGPHNDYETKKCVACGKL